MPCPANVVGGGSPSDRALQPLGSPMNSFSRGVDQLARTVDEVGPVGSGVTTPCRCGRRWLSASCCGSSSCAGVGSAVESCWVVVGGCGAEGPVTRRRNVLGDQGDRATTRPPSTTWRRRPACPSARSSATSPRRKSSSRARTKSPTGEPPWASLRQMFARGRRTLRQRGPGSRSGRHGKHRAGPSDPQRQLPRTGVVNAGTRPRRGPHPHRPAGSHRPPHPGQCRRRLLLPHRGLDHLAQPTPGTTVRRPARPGNGRHPSHADPRGGCLDDAASPTSFDRERRTWFMRTDRDCCRLTNLVHVTLDSTIDMW